MILLFQAIVYPFISHLIGLAVGLFMHVVISSCFFFFLQKCPSDCDWLSHLPPIFAAKYKKETFSLLFFFSLWQCNTLNWLIAVNRTEARSINRCHLLSSLWQIPTASHVYWSIQLLGDSLNRALSIWSVWNSATYLSLKVCGLLLSKVCSFLIIL